MPGEHQQSSYERIQVLGSELPTSVVPKQRHRCHNDIQLSTKLRMTFLFYAGFVSRPNLASKSSVASRPVANGNGDRRVHVVSTVCVTGSTQGPVGFATAFADAILHAMQYVHIGQSLDKLSRKLPVPLLIVCYFYNLRYTTVRQLYLFNRERQTSIPCILYIPITNIPVEVTI
ncbi:hypothetical protein M378DRAFT_794467 [Amanita muscaria Koide BX008]|uniref:Uncharacterized protein n=1 Tax=Amanita muscaria (strain Koide BX008) TaxID=946122 RepID=A0A0C2SKR1_AMAMK|nr:hypothetical protein M378DRAFT_794467 [Amanita muscaria Koide BX008]